MPLLGSAAMYCNPHAGSVPPYLAIVIHAGSELCEHFANAATYSEFLPEGNEPLHEQDVEVL